MSNDVAGLLHESIDRLTEGARAPAGLADRALRRYRKRRVTLGTTAVIGTATAAAVSVFVATALAGGARQHGTGGLPVQTTGYVVSRTERALASAERGNLIQEIRTVGHNASLALTELVPVTIRGPHGSVKAKVARPVAPFVPEAVTWSYRRQLRQQGFDAAGRLVFDGSSSTVLTGVTPKEPREGFMRASGVSANYLSRTWWHGTIAQGVERDTTPLACNYAYLPPPVGSPVDWTAKVAWPAKIRAALACGHFRVAGRQWIDGVDAIRMVSVQPPWPAAPFSQSLWVSPRSYLPLRLTMSFTSPVTHKVVLSLVGDFRWLPPTKANLAALRVTVPPGFRQRHTGGLPVPGSAYEPAGLGHPEAHQGRGIKPLR